MVRPDGELPPRCIGECGDDFGAPSWMTFAGQRQGSDGTAAPVVPMRYRSRPISGQSGKCLVAIASIRHASIFKAPVPQRSTLAVPFFRWNGFAPCRSAQVRAWSPAPP